MPNGSSRNQTLSFLMRRFDEAGIRPYTRFGQNFLIDLNLQRLLLESARLGPDDVVLEVGTGTGSLTVLMAQAAAAVVTVEIDRQLFQLAGEELLGLENVTQLQLDALKNKNRLNPEMLEAVSTHLDAAPGRRLKLVSNLPYNVATPILSNLLALERPPHSMTVTIQKELAERITASPRTKDYGSLSIWVQSQCRAEIVRIMPPEVFWPRPKVFSAIIQITHDEKLRNRIPDREFFHTFNRAMFFHRRKFLRSELLSAFKNRLDKPQVDAILAAVQIAPNARAEQLDVETMLRLCEAVRAEVGIDAEGTAEV
ncbi:MAG TPA: 16S rRNA (adenine(1518)-N(6)/adenine(1519)-N(6))-dimethyltransferase RsmA [Thermoguttaceae bacterium]|nr:16S rRNA (adenine(1518)-N(6)/adenine(1519)-N(6))-dimethyltransferase RsmA [Thermoguttaceae bacterium]HUT95593.1 16S rRNA (adenine(1518)-N(6)/adenine(1519)-N(6))-dimethyltransferase RsmA [Thermoguttaceae bacterium]